MDNRAIAVELVLENCVSIKFKTDDIFFALSNVTEKIHGWGTQISKSKQAEEILMKIPPEANTIKAFDDIRLVEGLTPFDRLRQYQDIVAVRVYYADNSNEYIYLNWGGTSDEVNEYQSTGLHTKTGELCIVVSEYDKVHRQFYADNAYGQSFEIQG